MQINFIKKPPIWAALSVLCCFQVWRGMKKPACAGGLNCEVLCLIRRVSGNHLGRWEFNISATWASWSCLSKMLSTGTSTESTV